MPSIDHLYLHTEGFTTHSTTCFPVEVESNSTMHQPMHSNDVPSSCFCPIFDFYSAKVRRLGRRPETAERHSSSAVRCTGIGGDKSNWAVNKFDSMISIISFATQFSIVLVEMFPVLIGNISFHLFSIVRKL